MKSKVQKKIDLGYLRQFNETYTLGKKIGKGGNGTVYIATKKEDNTDFAVKIIPKILKDARLSQKKRDGHLDALRREVEVMLTLRGNLNVANLEAVYEDDENILLVIELCSGGELLERAGTATRHYSERTVASIMRNVLQTVAQCHARNILHRDIKPENFLFLTTSPSSPIKAIDFGLAVICPPHSLPLTAETAEGTPWFLAPEVCRGKSYPASDVWSCGILAAYLLTGIYPFIDRMFPDTPDLARTLRVICYEELDQTRPEWAGLGDESLDFVKSLLVKDPLKRPSAIEALAHPWLQDSPGKKDRPLHHSVVQRIQRFAQSSLFKRRVLECIAADLVKMHFAKEKSIHGGATFNERSIRGGHAFFEGSRRGSRRPASRDASMRFISENSRSRSLRFGGSIRAGREGSMHGSMHSSLTAIPSGIYLPIATPFSHRLSVVLDSLSPGKNGRINKSDLIDALHKLGYKVDDQEAGELFDAVDVLKEGSVKRDELSASLVDWKSVQDTFKDRWVESVKRVFEDLDKDGDGSLTADELSLAFAGQLSTYEVDAAVHDALIEALGDDVNEDGGDSQQQEGRIDFEHFLRILQNGSGVLEDLAFYDDRLSDHTSRHASGDVNDMIREQQRQRRNAEGGGLFSCFNCFSS